LVGLTPGIDISIFIFQLGMKECEDLVLDFVKKWTPPRKCPLGGNSIGQVSIPMRFIVSIDKW
jgi:oligoribonuclease (3'-5' exoribonuclease)